jgi:hypothetical protein
MQPLYFVVALLFCLVGAFVYIGGSERRSRPWIVEMGRLFLFAGLLALLLGKN